MAEFFFFAAMDEDPC